jgi:hypothetical protein
MQLVAWMLRGGGSRILPIRPCCSCAKKTYKQHDEHSEIAIFVEKNANDEEGKQHGRSHRLSKQVVIAFM